MADIKHIKELIEEIDLCMLILQGAKDYKVGILRSVRRNHKDSGKEQIISLEDLEELLKHTPRPMDTVEVECTEWYKEYMEKKYGKTSGG